MFFVEDWNRESEDFEYVFVSSSEQEAQAFADSHRKAPKDTLPIVSERDFKSLIDMETQRRLGPLAQVLAVHGLGPMPAAMWLVITGGRFVGAYLTLKAAMDAGGDRIVNAAIGAWPEWLCDEVAVTVTAPQRPFVAGLSVYDPAPGPAVAGAPDAGKGVEDCKAKYSNLTNFRGYDPGPGPALTDAPCKFPTTGETLARALRSE